MLKVYSTGGHNGLADRSGGLGNDRWTEQYAVRVICVRVRVKANLEKVMGVEEVEELTA